MLAALLLTVAAPVSAATGPLTVAAARMAQVGRWQGKLEYRDYQADRWFGLPVTVEVRDGGDGVALLRVADFDDGPKVGAVRITTASMLLADGARESSVSLRKGRDVELSTARLSLREGATGPANWTLVSEETGRDDDRPARIRVTTARAGDQMVALKEVDFTDDAAEAWLVRNRTTLRRLGD
ncbi:hypothetical protein OMW55_08315 [Sphingomonas sp. BN140010]|uniref:Uncharacterized protein n=1 Tax=Sphingomonas arvum TaxID=2992113 RepID=A0ABT3JFE6_9SPHN|nr:hypothetical protein [Sphingomonas sp. BN140010]MCW3797805.1 hypothetical protein [Sphingomonas sp. BN140010]